MTLASTPANTAPNKARRTKFISLLPERQTYGTRGVLAPLIIR